MLEITQTGNVGRVKLVKNTKGSVLNLNLATNRKLGDREFTDWVSAKIWGERAEKLAPYIQKGTKLLIKGRPEARGYLAADGTSKAELIVHVSELEFLSPKGPSGENPPEHEEDGEDEAELALETAEA